MVVWTYLCAGVTGKPVVQIRNANIGMGIFAQKEEKMEVKVTFCYFVFPGKSSVVLGRLFFEDCVSLRALENLNLNYLDLKKLE